MLRDFFTREDGKLNIVDYILILLLIAVIIIGFLVIRSRISTVFSVINSTIN